MKIYISADIEGITGTTNWNETEKGKSDYNPFAEQMTKEVKAACEGAVGARVKEIVVKDAHDSARNIDGRALPHNVKLIRGWSGHPFCMVTGLDETFDAAIFIGYHSAAGTAHSPLAHTLATHLKHIKINGEYASEFLIHGYAAASVGVPVVFVSGDKGLTEEVKKINKNISVLPVKEGIGGATVSIHPDIAVDFTKEYVEQILKSDYKDCLLKLPEEFEVEIAYINHERAYRYSFYPGVTQIAQDTLFFKTKDYFEVLRMMLFLT
jgi:D-amino peptidase